MNPLCLQQPTLKQPFSYDFTSTTTVLYCTTSQQHPHVYILHPTIIVHTHPSEVTFRVLLAHSNRTSPAAPCDNDPAKQPLSSPINLNPSHRVAFCMRMACCPLHSISLLLPAPACRRLHQHWYDASEANRPVTAASLIIYSRYLLTSSTSVFTQPYTA